MKDRIAHIMRAKNLKASDFAAQIGIQPSAISHILAGRNNPSLEIVKKIKETFPEYNLDWIIFGTGPMTLSEPFKTPVIDPAKEPAQETPFASTLFDTDSFVKPSAPPAAMPSIESYEAPATPLPTTAIKSVIILYEDGTFETFSPR